MRRHSSSRYESVEPVEPVEPVRPVNLLTDLGNAFEDLDYGSVQKKDRTYSRKTCSPMKRSTG